MYIRIPTAFYQLSSTGRTTQLEVKLPEPPAFKLLAQITHRLLQAPRLKVREEPPRLGIVAHNRRSLGEFFRTGALGVFAGNTGVAGGVEDVVCAQKASELASKRVVQIPKC